jgi:hypothetical protein
MDRAIRLLSLILAIAGALAWLVLGAHGGWTQTSVPVKTVDAVTGIEGIEYHKQFVPGLDFLAGAFAGAGLLAGASFLFRNQQSTQSKP